MKGFIARALPILFAAVIASHAEAEQDAVDTGKGGLYLGIKGIYTNLKVDGADNSGGAGLLIADHFGNGFGMELEASRSQADINLLESVNDYTLDTAGLYGVYRSAGALYLKARAGVVWKRLEAPVDTVTKSSFAGGFGAGYDFGRVLVEAEYHYIDEDIDQFSIAVIGKF